MVSRIEKALLEHSLIFPDQVFDKLCTVFGQDIWDALFLRTMTDSNMPRNTINLFLHFIAALIYVDILFCEPSLKPSPLYCIASTLTPYHYCMRSFFSIKW